jgi:pyroglutamyl-peptidase
MAGRVLLGGFNSFGRHAHNPASEIALPAVEQLDHVDTVALPVNFDEAYPALREAYDSEQHRAVLIFGLGSHATSLAKIETRSRNFDLSVLFADAAHHRRLGSIDPGQQWSRPVTIDTEVLKRDMETAGVRARFSRDAGSYVCNHLLYQATAGLDAPVGFVHLGRGMSDEQVAGAARATASSLLDRYTESE